MEIRTLFTSNPWLRRVKYVAVDGGDCALRVVWLAAKKAKIAIRPATYRFIIVPHD